MLLILLPLRTTYNFINLLVIISYKIFIKKVSVIIIINIITVNFLFLAYLLLLLVLIIRILSITYKI